MEPTLLPKTKSRKFRSEAEYRLWQHELTANVRQDKRGEGLLSRIVNRVRNMASRQQDAPRQEAPRVRGRSDRRPAKQHS
ncbi:MAG: hypothetical protein JXA10_01260 [Anaerolineae bacterium]|nr:hypothetical protein [Anaerolineae bacterium]